MARITIEDCLQRVDNRFELVLMATQRARQIEHGVPATVPENGDKPAVVALREIAGNTIDFATIDAIDRDRREQAARQAIEWAAAEWSVDDDSDDEDTAAPRTEPVSRRESAPVDADGGNRLALEQAPASTPMAQDRARSAGALRRSAAAYAAQHQAGNG